MSEKKGLLGKLFGGKPRGGCCNMEIAEEPERDGDCCDSNDVSACCETASTTTCSAASDNPTA